MWTAGMLPLLTAIRRWPLWLRLGTVITAVAAIYLFQVPLKADVPGDPFLLFLLVVLALTFAFGRNLGLCAAAVTAVLSTHFFEPGGTVHIHHAADLIKVELYLVLASISAIATARLVDGLLDACAASARLAARDTTKTVLLRELSHRVANNFATIASLMRRQAATVADPGAKSALAQAVNQVTIMARVHRRLHADGEDVSVDAGRFIGELCEDLKDALASGSPIAICARAVNHSLSLAQAVPLGLIVNELVTNAIKYAFADGRSGTIWVSLERRARELLLEVRDDGIGIGQSKAGSGIGHMLIEALGQQLGGRLAVASSHRGTTISVAFPASQARTQPLATVP
jgi:two-component system, sensor histidine kinase PdtaS